jgi:type IV pilus assembly protein PilB
MEAATLLPLLQQHAHLTAAQAADLVDEQQRSGKTIEELLGDYGVLDERRLAEFVASALGADFYDLEEVELTPDVLSAIPSKTCRFHDALPIAAEGETITVVLLDPLNPQTRDDIQFITNKEIHVAVAPASQVSERLNRYFGSEAISTEELLAQLRRELAPGASDEDAAHAAPIIKFVNTILEQAIRARASDIHFEPFENDFKIRYRVDGALYEMSPPPRSLATSITSRIKVMAGLNIAERRLPQDGRIQANFAGHSVDLRISTLPTQFGESVVLRVLDRTTVNLDIEQLGMPPKIYSYIADTIEKPNGIFIVTGPTGSGKTTTLYACVNRINRISSKILTVEDPVEYDIEGIQQVAVHEGIGLSFARALRAFLRQDPDRIMIGETRDFETAQIAIQASLTGHLVFTTIHTIDAPGAVTRLIDMGIEPFYISATLEAVLSQRLIRTICTDCRTSYEPDEAVLTSAGLSAHEVGEKMFYYGRGCPKCNQTGYRGRKGIFELLDISDPIRDLINQKAPTVVIRQKAIEHGMQTLREDGLRCVFDGITTIEEVIKYT